MFRGVSKVTLDVKGRMSLPSKYRDQLGKGADALVITIDVQEKCLLMYPHKEWEQIERKLDNLPSFNAAARRVQRLLIGHASEVSLDSHGRLLVPTPLRDFASLEKQVVLLGQGRKFEIWDEEHWESRRDTWIEESIEPDEDLPDDLRNITI